MIPGRLRAAQAPSPAPRLLWIALLAAVWLPGAVPPLSAQTDPPPTTEHATGEPAASPASELSEPDLTPAEERMVRAWQAGWTPGEAHDFLASRAGEWSLVTRTWAQPGAEPMITESTATRRMILGGRVLEEVVTGEILGLGFEGRGFLGFDNLTGRWWSTWMDTMSTAPVTTVGSPDTLTGDLVLRGDYVDPLSGERRKVRTVLRFSTPDREVFQWWEQRGPKEVLTMEIRYERVVEDEESED